MFHSYFSDLSGELRHGLGHVGSQLVYHVWFAFRMSVSGCFDDKSISPVYGVLIGGTWQSLKHFVRWRLRRLHSKFVPILFRPRSVNFMMSFFV